MSGMSLFRRYLPGMMERKWGRIVFISSKSGVQNAGDRALRDDQGGAARRLARHRRDRRRHRRDGERGSAGADPLRGSGRVHGQAGTIQGKSIKEFEAEFIEENRPSSLIRRLAEVEEVANLVVYVCSPRASATTGAALRVDGEVVRSILESEKMP